MMKLWSRRWGLFGIVYCSEIDIQTFTCLCGDIS